MDLSIDEMTDRLLDFAEAPQTRLWRVAYESLSRPEQVFRLVWDLDGEVNNGGFHQYFHNSSGALAPLVSQALRQIGGAVAATIVDRALASVGAMPWLDEKVRRERMTSTAQPIRDALDRLDEEFYRCPDNLTELLYAFAAAHRDQLGVDARF
jgi:hypothetical protein